MCPQEVVYLMFISAWIVTAPNGKLQVENSDWCTHLGTTTQPSKGIIYWFTQHRRSSETCQVKEAYVRESVLNADASVSISLKSWDRQTIPCEKSQQCLPVCGRGGWRDWLQGMWGDFWSDGHVLKVWVIKTCAFVKTHPMLYLRLMLHCM